MISAIQEGGFAVTDQVVITPAFHHVNLKTTRLQEMIDWYGDVIGTAVVHQYEGGAWMTNDAANHRIALISVPGLEDDPEKIRHTGLHHTAFEYASIDDLLSTYVRLKGSNVTPHACLDHGMTLSFYYADPDGNSLELQADWFGDWSQSKQFMLESADFEKDPVGPAVDPDQLVLARAKQTPLEDLHKRSYGREFAPDHPTDMRLPVAADS
jgi:catechol 2,3-dioxygenase